MEPVAGDRAGPTELKPEHLYYGIIGLVVLFP